MEFFKTEQIEMATLLAVPPAEIDQTLCTVTFPQL
jgi:hypothetical protein